MEKIGLSLAELEAQQVELLPDRIEMRHRRRHWRINNLQSSTSVVSQAVNNNINTATGGNVFLVVVPDFDDDNGPPGPPG